MEQVILGQLVLAGEQGLQLGRLRGPAGQRGHDRERLLPCAQVGHDRLAGHLGRAPDAEQVVGELEGEADVPAELGQAHGELGRGAHVHRADRAGAGHQRGRLVARHLDALGQGHVAALFEREVLALPGDQPLHRGGQAARRPQAARGGVLEQQVVRQGEHRVAGQDRRADAEHGPRGRAVPPLGVPVHDVVVQQREVVHKLDRDRGADAALGGHARGAGGKQGERGAQRLAAPLAHRVPLSVGEAVVVGSHPANAGAQPVDRGLRGRSDQVTRHGDASGHHDRHERTSLSFASVFTSVLDSLRLVRHSQRKFGTIPVCSRFG